MLKINKIFSNDTRLFARQFAFRVISKYYHSEIYNLQRDLLQMQLNVR